MLTYGSMRNCDFNPFVSLDQTHMNGQNCVIVFQSGASTNDIALNEGFYIWNYNLF